MGSKWRIDDVNDDESAPVGTLASGLAESETPVISSRESRTQGSLDLAEPHRQDTPTHTPSARRPSPICRCDRERTTAYFCPVCGGAILPREVES
jgi:hypothetical protein